MKTLVTSCLFILLGVFATAQTQHTYDYDANGNRIARNTIYLTPFAGGNSQTTILPNNLSPTQIEAGTQIDVSEDVALAVYPNPTTQHITVSLQQTEVLVREARLYSNNGSVKHTLKNPESEFSISLDGMAAGNYILWLQLTDGSIKRVTVVKL